MGTKKNYTPSFGSKIEFVHDIFADLRDPFVVMASSAKYKLSKTFENYCKELENSSWTLQEEDPMKVLDRMDRDL